MIVSVTVCGTTKEKIWLKREEQESLKAVRDERLNERRAMSFKTREEWESWDELQTRVNKPTEKKWNCATKTKKVEAAGAVGVCRLNTRDKRSSSLWVMEDFSCDRGHHALNNAWRKANKARDDIQSIGDFWHFIFQTLEEKKKIQSEQSSAHRCSSYVSIVISSPRSSHRNHSTHTQEPYSAWPPSILVEGPRDHERGRGVVSGPGRRDNPALTECQYKAIYKRMRNRPSITGNFSAPLPQEAWPASPKWAREAGDKEGRGGEGWSQSGDCDYSLL